MLVLTRRLGESIAVDKDARITVLEIQGSEVRLGIEGPATTEAHHEEILAALRASNREASGSRSLSEKPVAPSTQVKKVARVSRAS